MFTAGGLLTFSYQRNNPLLSKSSIPFSVGVSTNNSKQISIKPTLYGKNDFLHTYAEFWYKDLPDHYWGVGYDKGMQVHQSDSATAYHRKWLRVYAKVVRQFFPNVFAGAVVDVNMTRASNVNARMEEDADFVRTGHRSKNSGLGVSFQYDSRDMSVNAYEGMLMDVTYIHYDKLFRGEHEFDVLELDYRQFASLGYRHVLAWNVKTRWAMGDDVPYTELSQLGSPFDLRGYYWGRFRDKNSAIILMEYRHMFNRRTLNRKGNYDSPFGFVTWIGSGAITPELMHDDIYWLPNAGLGVRVEVQPRMNVRVDWGVGKDTRLFYITLNEAF